MPGRGHTLYRLSIYTESGGVVSDLTPGRPDLAIATVLGGGAAPRRNRVAVDLSAFSTNRIIAEYDDFDRIPMFGDLVDAVDIAGQREATAEIVGVNEQQRTAALTIDWDTIREVLA